MYQFSTEFKRFTSGGQTANPRGDSPYYTFGTLTLKPALTSSKQLKQSYFLVSVFLLPYKPCQLPGQGIMLGEHGVIRALLDKSAGSEYAHKQEQ